MSFQSIYFPWAREWGDKLMGLQQSTKQKTNQITPRGAKKTTEHQHPSTLENHQTGAIETVIKI